MEVSVAELGIEGLWFCSVVPNSRWKKKNLTIKITYASARPIKTHFLIQIYLIEDAKICIFHYWKI